MPATQDRLTTAPVRAAPAPQHGGVAEGPPTAKDGAYSQAAHHQGACSYYGAVAEGTARLHCYGFGHQGTPHLRVPGRQSDSALNCVDVFLMALLYVASQHPPVSARLS